MQGQDLRWLPAATRAPNSRPRPGARQAWWQRLLHALRYPVWPMVIMVLALSGLLLLFQRVVAQGVVQGEQRRNAITAHSEGLWRCRLLNQPDERRRCLVQVGQDRE